MKFVVTIDTEEDNWGVYRSTGWTLRNIERIPGLQDLFNEFNVKPTYLITYPVATDAKAVSILKAIADQDRCEIGTHCHPWNTPPCEEETNSFNSMLFNLPGDLQFKKISHLHNAIEKNFGIRPISFRAGRWGYGGDVAETLYKLGYQVDTSVTALTDWKTCHGPDYSHLFAKPYKFRTDNVFEESSAWQMLEVPASVGYLQRNFTLSHQVFKRLSRRPISRLRLIGLFYKFHILNKAWLSPENSDSNTMIKLANSMMKNDYNIINMFFHSPTLKAGNTPYTRTSDDERRFFRTIREFLAFAKDCGIESIKLRDAMQALN